MSDSLTSNSVHEHDMGRSFQNLNENKLLEVNSLYMSVLNGFEKKKINWIDCGVKRIGVLPHISWIYIINIMPHDIYQPELTLSCHKKVKLFVILKDSSGVLSFTSFPFLYYSACWLHHMTLILYLWFFLPLNHFLFFCIFFYSACWLHQICRLHQMTLIWHIYTKCGIFFFQECNPFRKNLRNFMVCHKVS